MLLAPFLWIFCEFDEKVLDNLSLVPKIEVSRNCFSIFLQTFVLYSNKYTLPAQALVKNFTKTTLYRPSL